MEFENTTNDSLSGGDDGSMNTAAILYISAEVINGVISVLGNAIVLAAIFKTTSLHTVTNVFIVSLAMADVFVGFLVAPVAVSVYKSFPVNFYVCLLLNTVILMFTNVSILMLLAVAVERFIAISRPFTYVRLMTVRRAIVINVFVWLLGILLGLTPMYGWHKSEEGFDKCAFTSVIRYDYMVYFQFFGLVILPLLVMLIIYVYILRVVHYHTSRDSRHNSLFNEGGHRQRRKEFQKDVKAAKYFALIILLFAIFWLPINILNTISLFWPHVQCPIEILLVAIVLSHANSSINPFLYAASNSRIKRAMKTILHMPIRPGEDFDNTDMPRDHRPSSASHEDGLSTGQRSVSVALVQGELGLPYPFSKSQLMPNGKENRDKKAVGNTSPPHVTLNASTLTDAAREQQRVEGYSNCIKTDNGQETRFFEPIDTSTQENNLSIPTTPSNSLPSVSPKQYRHLFNGHIKHNQVLPMGDVEQNNAMTDLDLIQKQTNSENISNVVLNGTGSAQTGYHNPAYCPSDPEDHESPPPIVPTNNDSVLENSVHSSFINADTSSNHSSTHAHDRPSITLNTQTPSPSGESFKEEAHQAHDNGNILGNSRSDPDDAQLEADIASAIQQFDEIMDAVPTSTHSISPVFHRRDHPIYVNIHDSQKDHYIDTERGDDVNTTVSETDDEVEYYMKNHDEKVIIEDLENGDSAPDLYLDTKLDHKIIDSTNGNSLDLHCEHCDSDGHSTSGDSELKTVNRHKNNTILVNLKTEHTRL